MYTPQPTSPFSRLQRLARPKSASEPEHCELCSAPIPSEHPHVLELSSRQLRCACNACAILFSTDDSPRFRRVPRDIQRLDDFNLTDESFSSLQIPINLAFFYRKGTGVISPHSITALYPSPAGATESTLPIDSWSDLVSANPILQTMQPDIEALLINRIAPRRDAFIAPIDHCYRLTGIIRTHWRGLSGGTDVWREIAKFFDHLNLHAKVPSHA